VASRSIASATPRAVAAYLVDLRGPLGDATQYRKAWVQRIGVLMEDSGGAHPLTITQTAGQIGREHGANFRRVRAGFARLRPPPGCTAVHGAFGRWLDKLIEACDLLRSVARSGDIQRLRETQDLFSEGRRHAHVFNEEYARVVDELRQQVSAVQRDRTRHPERPRARRPSASRHPWPSKSRPTVVTRSF
jgi:hypothetical protein